jgi:hypothetical protein
VELDKLLKVLVIWKFVYTCKAALKLRVLERALAIYIFLADCETLHRHRRDMRRLENMKNSLNFQYVCHLPTVSLEQDSYVGQLLTNH